MDGLRIVIPLMPITKKNSQRILINPGTRKPFIAPSEKYKSYEKACGWILAKYGQPKIDYPVNVQALYYMPTRRRVDLTNLHEALHDILVKTGILEDDNCKIIVSTDGSRVLYDKINPRTEVYITKANEQEDEQCFLKTKSENR